MKTANILYQIFSVSFVILVLLQFGPDLKRPTKVAAEELADALEGHWKKLRRANLVSGTLLITQEEKVLFSDGDVLESYPIASLSKSVVGYAFFELQQQGKITLDQKVCMWMKNFCQGPFSKITLQQLLNHQAGFGRDLNFLNFLKRAYSIDWQLANLDTFKLEPTDLKFQSGEQFAYSNFGYLILSRVLEVIEKQNFEQIILSLSERHGIDGLGLANLQDSFSTELLVPYTELSARIPLQKEARNSAGAGGLKASAQALQQWLTLLEEKEIPFLFAKDTKESYQFGLVKSKRQSYQAYWHNGASPGTYTLMVTIPEQKLKIVLLTKNLKLIKAWSDAIEQFEKYFN